MYPRADVVRVLVQTPAHVVRDDQRAVLEPDIREGDLRPPRLPVVDGARRVRPPHDGPHDVRAVPVLVRVVPCERRAVHRELVAPVAQVAVPAVRAGVRRAHDLADACQARVPKRRPRRRAAQRRPLQRRRRAVVSSLGRRAGGALVGNRDAALGGTRRLFASPGMKTRVQAPDGRRVPGKPFLRGTRRRSASPRRVSRRFALPHERSLIDASERSTLRLGRALSSGCALSSDGPPSSARERPPEAFGSHLGRDPVRGSPRGEAGNRREERLRLDGEERFPPPVGGVERRRARARVARPPRRRLHLRRERRRERRGNRNLRARADDGAARVKRRKPHLDERAAVALVDEETRAPKDAERREFGARRVRGAALISILRGIVRTRAAAEHFAERLERRVPRAGGDVLGGQRADPRDVCDVARGGGGLGSAEGDDAAPG